VRYAKGNSLCAGSRRGGRGDGVVWAPAGRIDLQSELGRGTQFTLEFPMPKRIA
jgi:hypothetical protein